MDTEQGPRVRHEGRGSSTGGTGVRAALVRAARRSRDVLVLGLGVVAIIGASVIGLNDWADAQATAAPHASATTAADQV